MPQDAFFSYEFARRHFKFIDKFKLRRWQYGLLSAIQNVRELRRLHTYYPLQREELDYTKYGLWLYPNADWNEPLFYFTGLGLDHYSGALAGYLITVDP